MSFRAEVQTLDLVVRGGRVLVSDSSDKYALEPLDVGVRGGVIASLSPRSKALRGSVEVDATGCIVAPGFINGHTHSYSACEPGLAADAPLDVLIPRARALVGGLAEDAHYVAAHRHAEIMLASGITTLLDQPAQGLANPHSVTRAYRDVGIRAYVAPMVSDLPYEGWLPGTESRHSEREAAATEPFSGSSATDEILNAVQGFVVEWSGAPGLVSPALGPFAPGVCSDRLLVGLGEIAARHDLPMHTHMAEAQWQATGGGLVRRLHRLGLLRPSFSMAHGVWIDQEGIGLLGDAGASVVHNPLSNLMLGNGIAPVSSFKAAGVGIALGTDGLNCGCTADFFEHMRLAVAVHRPSNSDWRSWHGASEVLRWATSGGAKALGASGFLGQIREGYRADLVVHRPVDSGIEDPDAAITSFVYTGSARGVRDVIVDGQVRIRNSGANTRNNDTVVLGRIDTSAPPRGTALTTARRRAQMDEWSNTCGSNGF